MIWHCLSSFVHCGYFVTVYIHAGIFTWTRNVCLYTGATQFPGTRLQCGGEGAGSFPICSSHFAAWEWKIKRCCPTSIQDSVSNQLCSVHIRMHYLCTVNEVIERVSTNQVTLKCKPVSIFVYQNFAVCKVPSSLSIWTHVFNLCIQSLLLYAFSHVSPDAY